MRKDKILLILGIIYVTYWFLDFLHNAVLPHNYSWLLWYSSAGLLITGIALIVQNIKIIYSLFCALFVIETLWIIDLLYATFTHHTLIGLTDYLFSPPFHIENLYFTLYHALIPTGLLLAIRRLSKTYQYGWLGAAMFATVIVTLSYYLTSPKSQVNCVHALNKCHTVFASLYQISNPYRTIIALLGLTVFVFIPTNRILLHFKKPHLKA